MMQLFPPRIWVFLFSPALALALFSSFSQAGDNQTNAAGVEFFEKRIRPLLVQHCYSCHSSQAKKVKGELRLDSRTALLKGGTSGPLLHPGKPAESLLIKAVRYNTDIRMPPKGRLSSSEIADLETWVKMGAPDPREDISQEATKKPAKSIDLDEAKKFWSFRPLQVLAPPIVKGPIFNVIDQFLLTKQEAKGLKPVDLANKRTLLRRVTFDLTGLPPTPEEIEAFLKDTRPDAFGRVVDRLLASSAYGERWGRHWLDVVRYADTAGDNSDFPVPQMYRYRNWVIDAFNHDMPYDQFVHEQIAGDLMSASSQPDRKNKIIATGYLANSRRHGSYEDARYPWHLTIEDTLDNLGKTFLGLTLGCARCHDHKFDPLTAEDYYGLYGFFSSTRYPWPGIELDRAPRDLVPLVESDEVEKVTQARKKQLAELDAVHKKLEADKAPKEKIQAAKKERDIFAKQPLPFETAYAVLDGKNEPKKRIGQIGDVRVQLKGEPDYPGQLVPRRFPLVLGGQNLPADVTGSGRLELARWLTEPTNPLPARVMVNRIWQYHFGEGLIPSSNNFGKQGQPPTYPELLDFLAHRFIEDGWSIKKMHRLIVCSRAYQLASTEEETNLKIDPANNYLWRYPRRRLDAEAIRDSILAISGTLDRSPGGPHPFPNQTTWDFSQHKPFKAVYDTQRRSVYLMTQRIQRHPFLALFDGPDTNASTALRPISTTPLQALFLMNDPFIHGEARKLANRLLMDRSSEVERIERAFLLAFGRPPTDAEINNTQGYLAQVSSGLRTAGLAETDLSNRAWESLARVLFISNEFIYVD
jgi:mono/diheme cytochrome c family protein